MSDVDCYVVEVRGVDYDDVLIRAMKLAERYFATPATELRFLPFKAEPVHIMETGAGGWMPSELVTATITVVRA